MTQPEETRPEEDDVQLSETAREEDQAQPGAQTSDEDAGDGQHGRPSDDSDPGHS